MQYLLKMLRTLLQILNRKFPYSRYNREKLQKDLYHCFLRDKNSNEKLDKVLHGGAYYCLYDVKEYRTKEYIPFAREYSGLVEKYVPNIDLEYPTNIHSIYEHFKKDSLSSH